MGNVVQVPAQGGEPHFVQDSHGWWWLNGHRVLRVDLQAMFVHIAANCPYDVDLDLNWLHSLIHPDAEVHQQKAAPPTKTFWQWLADILLVVLSVLAVLILLGLPVASVMVTYGWLRFGE